MVHRQAVSALSPRCEIHRKKRDGKVYGAQKEGSGPGHVEELDRVMRLYPETSYYWLRGRVPQR